MLRMIKYKLKAIFGTSFKRINKSIKICFEKSGKFKLKIAFGMIRCYRNFVFGHNDYIIFAFYDMNDLQRDTRLTRFRN